MIEIEPQDAGLEIHDPTLDGESIIRQVQQRVAQRHAEGAYGPSPAALGPESLRAGARPFAVESAAVGFPGLDEALAELVGRAQLQEPAFVSNAPLLGPLIVAIRRLWNWMSTKWYVLPILRQQSGINAQTARALGDLAQWHEMDSRRLVELETRIAELEAHLRPSTLFGDPAGGDDERGGSSA